MGWLKNLLLGGAAAKTYQNVYNRPIITPPYGLTMYLLCRISNIQITEFWKYMWPIFLAMVATLLAVTFYPPLTMWLPNLVMPVK